jgi:hypothetical protein
VRRLARGFRWSKCDGCGRLQLARRLRVLPLLAACAAIILRGSWLAPRLLVFSSRPITAASGCLAATIAALDRMAGFIATSFVRLRLVG